MIQFILQHEIITLIIVLSALWATERTIRSIVTRDKPECKCKCRCCDEDDEDEVVAMGGESSSQDEDEK